MLSIIIPALNEEKNLPSLLNSIKKQSLDEEVEVILADAGSKDRTVEIAEKFGCKIIKGGLPAGGRNQGAKIAQGELFLFLDADLRLPDDFLEKSLKEFKKRKLDIASYYLEPETNKKIIKVGFSLFYNRPIALSQKILSHGSGDILVKKEIFRKVKGGGGFDESIVLAEDHYFVRQASKIGKFGIIKSTKLYMPLRRFETDGYLKTCLKYLFCQLYMFSGKPPKSKLFKYEFDHYSANSVPRVKARKRLISLSVRLSEKAKTRMKSISPPLKKKKNKL
jgi:glycosyltransferase involved in cell wall biosynthesis